jgi:hypothetical protein
MKTMAAAKYVKRRILMSCFLDNASSKPHAMAKKSKWCLAVAFVDFPIILRRNAKQTAVSRIATADR